MKDESSPHLSSSPPSFSPSLFLPFSPPPSHHCLLVRMGSGASVTERSRPDKLGVRGADPDPELGRSPPPAGQSDNTAQVNDSFVFAPVRTPQVTSQVSEMEITEQHRIQFSHFLLAQAAKVGISFWHFYWTNFDFGQFIWLISGI